MTHMLRTSWRANNKNIKIYKELIKRFAKINPHKKSTDNQFAKFFTGV